MSLPELFPSGTVTSATAIVDSQSYHWAENSQTQQIYSFRKNGKKIQNSMTLFKFSF